MQKEGSKISGTGKTSKFFIYSNMSTKYVHIILYYLWAYEEKKMKEIEKFL